MVSNELAKPSIKTIFKPATGDGHTVVKKEANRVFRWNILFLAAIMVMLTFPAWFLFIPVVNLAIPELIVSIMICFHLIWLMATINAVKTVYQLRKQVKVSVHC